MTDNQKRANDYLMRIRNADRDITELILKIDYLRYKASGAGAIRYDKDHVQTSPEDMMCEAISEAVMLERELTTWAKRIKDAREYTEKVISLWNDNCSRLIDIYYLKHGSMVDVARQIGCADRSAYAIKQKALEKFSKHL